MGSLNSSCFPLLKKATPIARSTEQPTVRRLRLSVVVCCMSKAHRRRRYRCHFGSLFLYSNAAGDRSKYRAPCLCNPAKSVSQANYHCARLPNTLQILLAQGGSLLALFDGAIGLDSASVKLSSLCRLCGCGCSASSGYVDGRRGVLLSAVSIDE